MKLSKTEYLATLAEPMKRLDSDAEAPFDFWKYFAEIPPSDFEGHNFSAGLVTYVWEHPNGRYQHVLINSETHNIFLVVVLDLLNHRVLGHHLLDLNLEYGGTGT